VPSIHGGSATMSVIQKSSRPLDESLPHPRADAGLQAGRLRPAPFGSASVRPAGTGATAPPPPPIERRAAYLTAARRGDHFGLSQGGHVCLIYERAAEARTAVLAFFVAGLAAGERCLYYGSAAAWRRIENALADAYLPAGTPRGAATRASGREEEAAAGRRRRGDPAAWLDRLLDAERQALAEGFSGLCASWEMPLGPGLERRHELAEMESLIERRLAGSRITLLCRYSRQRTPTAVLLHAVRHHPAAMVGGEIGGNAFYEPPRGASGAPPGERRVSRMLAQLRHGLRRERRLRDVERRLAHSGAQLERADQDREQLIAMLAHELRNPLSTVSVALQVLRLRGGAAKAGDGAGAADGEADEPWKRALDTAERQVFHQAALVDDILEASRVTHGQVDLQREPLDLARLVGEVVDTYRDELREAGLGLDLELPHQAMPVLGDRLRLWQAMAHLLQNALRFSPPGSRVKVGLRGAADGRAEVVVSDSGAGISADLLPHVFETFTQADQSLDRAKGGLGLGLAVVKGLIELHGGEVRAASAGRSGEGAEFKLLLPLAAPAVLDAPAPGEGQPATAPAAAPAAAAPAARRVLVIEDSSDTAAILRDLLELLGHQVATAASGGEGVDAARRFHPDIVLCDLGLPGMNGFEVATALRRDPETASARLIALTGYGGDDDRRRSREAGFDVHLTKPVDPALLRHLLAATPPPASGS
jgi:signal transduction histidine kinase